MMRLACSAPATPEIHFDDIKALQLKARIVPEGGKPARFTKHEVVKPDDFADSQFFAIQSEELHEGISEKTGASGDENSRSGKLFAFFWRELGENMLKIALQD